MLPVELSLSYVERVFSLAIVDRSQSPVRVWSPSYSFGYYSVYFQVYPLDRKPCSIKRMAMRWTINIPNFILIQPGEAYRQDFDLNDGTWNLNECSGDPETEIEIAGVLEIAQDDNAVTHSILTGRYESNGLRFKSLMEIVT